MSNLMKGSCLALLVFSLAGCNSSKSEQATEIVTLGSVNQCQQYSGLPVLWGKSKTSGMVEIPAGEILFGSNTGYEDERPFDQNKLKVNAFWADRTEVTVAQFKSFVDATGYITDAEKQGGAAVFIKPETDNVAMMSWWKFLKNVSWKNIDEKFPALNEPVRYVTYNDALAYATWLGRDLPTELENEYLSKGFSDQEDIGPKSHGKITANYWQGEFPYSNSNQDGFKDIAPVGCFEANPFGLHDMIGNVWEWTNSVYKGPHSDMHMGNPQMTRHHSEQIMTMTIKGGSYLCADNYCARYRAAARHPQEFDLATSHVGFRTILRK